MFWSCPFRTYGKGEDHDPGSDRDSQGAVRLHRQRAGADHRRAGLRAGRNQRHRNASATTTADQNADDQSQDIVVTGIRASLQAALETKRNANAIVDSISAEDVGKFPNTNVAEALTLVPGVTVDRQFGQGEKVSILGTDPALNRTLLNGQTVASADWFILDSPGRTFNYALLAPQLIDRVDVYKSPEARIDEGSIGGTVNVSPAGRWT